jgi:uncharacterized protein (TIGR00251 family)
VHPSQKSPHPGSAIDIREVKEGCRIKVRARPGARTSAVEGEHAGALKVSIAAAPEKGRANEELIRFLAQALGVPRARVSVASGHASRDKVVAIAGLGAAEASERLLELILRGPAR